MENFQEFFDIVFSESFAGIGRNGVLQPSPDVFCDESIRNPFECGADGTDFHYNIRRRTRFGGHASEITDAFLDPGQPVIQIVEKFNLRSHASVSHLRFSPIAWPFRTVRLEDFAVWARLSHSGGNATLEFLRPPVPVPSASQ
jgi:hypothetical protein